MNQSLIPQAMIKRGLIGAVIGFILITVFLWGVPAKPEWSPYWKIRPMVVVPIASASGAAFSCFLDRFRKQGGWLGLLALLFSVFVFIVALWLGTVVGLDGTLWN